MTIVLGFRCTDGVVICADQQITAPGAFKYHQTKITVEDFEGFSAVFAYAGQPGLALEVHDKIAKVLRDLGEQESVSDAVRQSVDSVLSDMGRLYTQLELQMLIGTTAVHQKAALVGFDGKSVHAALPFNYLGIGESSLIRFLAQKLYTTKIDIRVGVDLGAYLIKKAEDYIDGCGGPIDVVTMADNYGLTRFSPRLFKSGFGRSNVTRQDFTTSSFGSPFLPPCHNSFARALAALRGRHSCCPSRTAFQTALPSEFREIFSKVRR